MHALCQQQRDEDQRRQAEEEETEDDLYRPQQATALPVPAALAAGEEMLAPKAELHLILQLLQSPPLAA